MQKQIVNKNVDPQECVICDNIFYVKKKNVKHSPKNILIRRAGCLTCSKKCSTKYNRIASGLRQERFEFRRKLKDKEKIIIKLQRKLRDANLI